jgi:hypothetical protein
MQDLLVPIAVTIPPLDPSHQSKDSQSQVDVLYLRNLSLDHRQQEALTLPVFWVDVEMIRRVGLITVSSIVHFCAYRLIILRRSLNRAFYVRRQFLSPE